MLREAGYRQRIDSRELVLQDPDNGTEFFFLRPRDIAIYVGSGRLDVGITGEDLLLDSGAQAEVVLPLGFAGSTFRFAAVPGRHDAWTTWRAAGSPPPTRACWRTTWPSNGITAEVIKLDGAVETAVRLGVADAIADVVETGTTLRAAGLEIFGEPLFQLPGRADPAAGAETSPAVEQLIRRLQGVMIARQYVLMDYDIADDLVEQAVAVTPGFESPTVSPLRTPGWSAVRSMVPRRDTNRIMDELWDIGARAILVTDIHACRL